MIVEQEQLKNAIDCLKIEVKAISNSYRSSGTPIDEDNLPLPLMIRLKSLQMAQARYDEIEQTLQSADDLTEVEILLVDGSSYDDYEELFALFLVGDAHPTTALREKQEPKKISAVSS